MWTLSVSGLTSVPVIQCQFFSVKFMIPTSFFFANHRLVLFTPPLQEGSMQATKVISSYSSPARRCACDKPMGRSFFFIFIHGTNGEKPHSVALRSNNESEGQSHHLPRPRPLTSPVLIITFQYSSKHNEQHIHGSAGCPIMTSNR